MEKRFWILLVVIIAVLAGVFFLTAPKDDNKASVDLKNNGNLDTVQTYDHIRGSKANKVVLIEYGDFQCPYCGAYFPYAQEAFDRYGSVVTFVYRDFPLVQIHPNAMSAARAAEAAAKQGKFWEMHDKLYANQHEWGDNALNASNIFEGYADTIGLNMDQYKEDYQSDAVNQSIQATMSDGKAQGVEGTPTLFLNGAKIQAPNSASAAPSYFNTIEAAIKKAGLKVPKTSNN